LIGPRAKLAALAALFALPIAASILAWKFIDPVPTGNFGELLLPPAQVSTQPFEASGGARFTFAQLGGKWILVASDSGDCPGACVEKLVTMRQVRLALGRNASRVERVFVVDDLRRPAAETLAAFSGMRLALTPAGMSLPPGAGNDRAHVYLVDPRGNVMMRWPASVDRKHVLSDLQRLLKASQIG
jgi:cytochrome oxidase Cu insertion factor (SCO1/SenC/PrrC family)